MGQAHALLEKNSRTRGALQGIPGSRSSGMTAPFIPELLFPIHPGFIPESFYLLGSDSKRRGILF